MSNVIRLEKLLLLVAALGQVPPGWPRLIERTTRDPDRPSNRKPANVVNPCNPKNEIGRHDATCHVRGVALAAGRDFADSKLSS